MTAVSLMPIHKCETMTVYLPEFVIENWEFSFY